MTDDAARKPTACIDTIEGRRLRDADAAAWRRWGPYISERQWGTVREDYSADGEAWAYFPHDHARWRAYRWGEDAIAGFCDEKQTWCLGLALWNGKDPILKERMFGLSNAEGNHGEDVKELWWYLDGAPSHALMRMLYKYPHAAFPYDPLVEENAKRDTSQPEYEVEDTGVFDDCRYFDVAVDYAKADPDDILMRVTVTNRGAEAAPLHVLPQLWARNTWSWDVDAPRPSLSLDKDGAVIARPANTPATTSDPSPARVVERRFQALQAAEMLFCDNDTNPQMAGQENAAPGFFKDGVDAFIVRGQADALNPAHTGTKCAAHAQLQLAPGASATLRFRFAPSDAAPMDEARFDAVFAERQAETDAFYAALQTGIESADARLVQRQALAGMLWSKQYYRFDVRRWLSGDPTQPPPPPERIRDRQWRFLDNDDVISMPDTWEYPWYASWDLAFHCVTLALIDPAYAKTQLLLLLQEDYMNPNGQIPAYEWGFGDANPPVQAWAALRIYLIDLAASGKPDTAFLRRALHKLMLNFTWWVNREDAEGRNLFQGGFLGLDNIGVFDRSKPLPTGGQIEQADATAWMAMYALDLMRIALTLAADDPVYEDIAIKFFDHFMLIAEAMADIDLPPEQQDEAEPASGLWDDIDGFYYDILDLPDGQRIPLRVRSLVGLIPLCVVSVLPADVGQHCPAFAERLRWTTRRRPEMAELVSHWEEKGECGRMLLSLLRYQRMTKMLLRMLDENEFLSPHGVRSVSKVHAAEPYTYGVDGQTFRVDYEPGTSTTRMFGGNSNWRGPVWMPINALLVEALIAFDAFYGDGVKVECPVGSGRQATLAEAAAELRNRLTGLFLKDAEGRRPALAGSRLAREDPHFADLVQFNEYFHGDTGEGLGASHQTGWTGLVALMLQPGLGQEMFAARL